VITSQRERFLSEILHELPIPVPEEKLAYFRVRLKRRFYNLVIKEIIKQRGRASGSKRSVNNAGISRRLTKRPEQITRLLQAPGNWTLDTISDLFLAICAGEPQLGISYLDTPSDNNYTPDVLRKMPSAEDSANGMRSEQLIKVISAMSVLPARRLGDDSHMAIRVTDTRSVIDLMTETVEYEQVIP